MADIRRQVGPDSHRGHRQNPGPGPGCPGRRGGLPGGGGPASPPTKPNAKGITREALADICAAVSLPVVAIGGITLQNARQLQGVGMAGLAVISALFAAPDITSRPPGTCWPCPDISRKEGAMKAALTIAGSDSRRRRHPGRPENHDPQRGSMP